MANAIPWSYSGLTAFETCPRRYKLTKLTKEVKEPQTEAQMHGVEVHKAIELAIKGEQPLPEKYSKYGPIVDKVTGSPGDKLVEYQFALTSSFKPTGFFDSDAWVRGVIDFANLRPTSATVLDWKTGKPKPDSDQLKLFALSIFHSQPQVDSARTGFVWLVCNKVDAQTYHRDEVSTLWREFLPRVRRLELAQEQDKFPPRPSGLCGKWCSVTRDKCEFSGRLS